MTQENELIETSLNEIYRKINKATGGRIGDFPPS